MKKGWQEKKDRPEILIPGLVRKGVKVLTWESQVQVTNKEAKSMRKFLTRILLVVPRH